MAAIAAILGALGASALSSAGGVLGNKWLQGDSQDFNAEEARKLRIFNQSEAQKARTFSAEEAQKARDFNQYMDSSKYQRTVADLEAAGVNPGLVLGSGVSTLGAAGNASAAAASGGSPASSGMNHITVPNTIAELFSRSFRDESLQEFYENADFRKAVLSNMSNDAKNAWYNAKTNEIYEGIESRKALQEAKKAKKKNEPAWLDDYVKNFESGVIDL